MSTRNLKGMFVRAMQVLVIVVLIFSVSGSVQAEGITHKVGMVTYLGGTDDDFNWLAYQGLLLAAENLSVTPSLYVPESSDDFELVLQQCALEGNELCIAVGFNYADFVAVAALVHPDTKWAIVDWSYPDCWEGATQGIDCVAPNVRGLRFNEKQAGYLAGVLAGEMTSGNTIGAVGGMEIPPVIDFLEGYRNGAQCTNTNVTVLNTYTGTFDDPEYGAAVAAEMISQGADVIFGAAGGTGNGAILYSAQNDQWAIGVDTDQYKTVFGGGTVDGSGNLLSSAMKRTDQAVYQTIEDYVYGEFTSGTVVYDLSSDGVGLAPFHETDSIIPQQVKDRIESVRQGIIDGTINVDFSCSPPPFFAVSLTQHWIMAGNFPPEAPITFIVYEHQGDSEPVRVLDWYSTDTIGFLQTQGWELGWDFVPGNYVVAEGGGVSKELVLADVSLDVFDPEHDLIKGTVSPAGTKVVIGVGNEEGEQWITDDNEDGDVFWEADFTIPGYEFNITEDSWAGAHVNDEDGDVTAAHHSGPPAPPMFIWTDPFCECINGWEWHDGDILALQIFDQDNNELELPFSTITYSAQSGAFFEFGEYGIDLQPGYRVVMSNGWITKEMVITNLAVKQMNPVTNIVSGVYDPLFDLGIHINNLPPISLEITEDQWVATFDSLDGYGEVYQTDEDGDKTGMGWDGVPAFMRYDIYAYDAFSGATNRVTTLDGTGEYDPTWSPNGKKIAHDVVYWDGSHGIFVTNVETGISTPLAGAEDGGNDAAWSPNGLWIAFDRRWVGEPNIYIVPAAGGERRLVYENALTPSWSPGGMRLVFQDAEDGKVKTIGLFGQMEISVADYGENPAWSHDGKWIAYQNDGDIWKVRVNPLGMPIAAPILVADPVAWVGSPAWSGDNKTIVFDSGEDDWDIWSVPVGGGDIAWMTGAVGYGDYGPDCWKNLVAYAGFTP